MICTNGDNAKIISIEPSKLSLEIDFEFYIPDRIEDGYGPSIKIME